MFECRILNRIQGAQKRESERNLYISAQVCSSECIILDLDYKRYQTNGDLDGWKLKCAWEMCKIYVRFWLKYL